MATTNPLFSTSVGISQPHACMASNFSEHSPHRGLKSRDYNFFHLDSVLSCISPRPLYDCRPLSRSRTPVLLLPGHLCLSLAPISVSLRMTPAAPTLVTYSGPVPPPPQPYLSSGHAQENRTPPTFHTPLSSCLPHPHN